ncbi:MAG: hypothetical protein ACR2HH_15035 [Chthoniobacterales bacterium]
MPLNNIVTIVLRLSSLSWLVQGITGLAAMAAARAASSPSLSYWSYAGPGCFLLAAVVAWLVAPALSRLATPSSEFTLNVGALTRYDLSSFAFVFLGLYFILSSVGNAINWLHYFIFFAATAPAADSQQRVSFYRLTQPLITLIAGGVCVAFASRLARKLTNVQRKYEAA